MKGTFGMALATVSCMAIAQQTTINRAVTHMSPAVAAFVAQEKDALAQYLFDPSSAQYKHLMVYSHPSGNDPGYCLMGEVNAKNAYGGYVGFRGFVNDVISPRSALDADSAAAAEAYTQASSACIKDGTLVYISES